MPNGSLDRYQYNEPKANPKDLEGLKVLPMAFISSMKDERKK